MVTITHAMAEYPSSLEDIISWCYPFDWLGESSRTLLSFGSATWKRHVMVNSGECGLASDW